MLLQVSRFIENICGGQGRTEHVASGQSLLADNRNGKDELIKGHVSGGHGG
jgi:hypothetical protein